MKSLLKKCLSSIHSFFFGKKKPVQYPLSYHIKEIEKRALEYGIDDIFSDNNYRLMQVLMHTRLKVLPGRNGNDAVDMKGNEYEVKTTSTKSFSTHHHVNTSILDKYENVQWIFANFENSKLKAIYHLHPMSLQLYWDRWRKRVADGSSINNPKIPLSYIQKKGRRIWKSR